MPNPILDRSVRLLITLKMEIPYGSRVNNPGDGARLRELTPYCKSSLLRSSSSTVPRVKIPHSVFTLPEFGANRGYTASRVHVLLLSMTRCYSGKRVGIPLVCELPNSRWREGCRRHAGSPSLTTEIPKQFACPLQITFPHHHHTPPKGGTEGGNAEGMWVAHAISRPSAAGIRKSIRKMTRRLWAWPN